MQFDKRIFAMMAAAVMMLSAATLVTSESDADQSYDRDYGEFYSYTLQFVFDGSDAQTIDWDFGDGSEHSTEWNPRHTYASTGTYYVTQTTSNPKGSTVEVYKVQIMGFPKISFDSNGGSAVSEIQMDSYNATATQPANPTKQGFTFDGWYYESTFENAMDWTAGITKSMTLYAKWTAVQAPVVNYTVTFDSNGGSAVQPQTVESGHVATAPADPVKSGYTFKGWYLGAAIYNFATPVTGNITLTASWMENTAPVVNRTVSFNVDGGSVAVSSITAVNGGSITLPSYSGVKEGYTFAGWSYNNITYQPGQSFSVSSDVTFKAVWRSTSPVVNEITVSFNVDGGSKSVQAVNIQSGSTFTFPAYDGTKDGCRFGGWACGLQVYQPGQTVQLTGDVTVKAIWNDASGSDDTDDKGLLEKIESIVTEHPLVIVLIVIVCGIGVFAIARSRRGY